MSEGWTTAVYLLLGLGLVAALYYAVTQITARQRRLEAELTRLERLTAEVSMSAEAILERVDERVELLQGLAAEVEAKVSSAAAEPARSSAPAKPEKPEKPAKPAKRSRRSAPKTEQPEMEEAQPTQPAAYSEIRTAVFAMADAGQDALDIAQALGIPRGEVQLLLNLRGRKATA